jgi:hypothetical protein
MKTNQFLILIGFIAIIASNTEDNHIMKVFWGVTAPFLITAGIIRWYEIFTNKDE